jgi:hypothetical protein
LARGFCPPGAGHGCTCTAHARLPPAGDPRPVSLPAKGIGAPKAPSGTRGRVPRWLTLVLLVSEGRPGDRGRAPTWPAGATLCHAQQAARGGCSARSLTHPIHLCLSQDAEGGATPVCPVRHLIRRRDVVCAERWRPRALTRARERTVTCHGRSLSKKKKTCNGRAMPRCPFARVSFHGAGRRNCGRAVGELALHAWRLLKCPIAGAGRPAGRSSRYVSERETTKKT